MITAAVKKKKADELESIRRLARRRVRTLIAALTVDENHRDLRGLICGSETKVTIGALRIVLTLSLAERIRHK